MRGEHEGDEVDITIDFRDQESGGEINPAISMQTETKTLTTDWQHYTMTATAPTSPANPVYASRLTFQARGKRDRRYRPCGCARTFGTSDGPHRTDRPDGAPGGLRPSVAS